MTPTVTQSMQRPALLHSSQRPYKRPKAYVSDSDSEGEAEERSAASAAHQTKKRRTDAGLQHFSALSLEQQPPASSSADQIPSLHGAPAAQGSTSDGYAPSTSWSGMEEDADVDMDNDGADFEEDEDEEQRSNQEARAFTLHSDIQARFDELEAVRKGLKPLPVVDSLPKPLNKPNEQPWGQLVLYRPLPFSPQARQTPANSPSPSPSIDESEDPKEQMDLD